MCLLADRCPIHGSGQQKGGDTSMAFSRYRRELAVLFLSLPFLVEGLWRRRGKALCVGSGLAFLEVSCRIREWCSRGGDWMCVGGWCCVGSVSL